MVLYASLLLFRRIRIRITVVGDDAPKKRNLSNARTGHPLYYSEPFSRLDFHDFAEDTSCHEAAGYRSADRPERRKRKHLPASTCITLQMFMQIAGARRAMQLYVEFREV